MLIRVSSCCFAPTPQVLKLLSLDNIFSTLSPSEDTSNFTVAIANETLLRMRCVQKRFFSACLKLLAQFFIPPVQNLCTFSFARAVRRK